MNSPDLIRTLLAEPTTIAVVGLSDNPAKPSHYVSAYMQQHGFKLYPINPALDEVLGEKSYPSLTALAESGVKPNLVNVFRTPNFIPAIVDEMLSLTLPNLGSSKASSTPRPPPTLNRVESTSSWTAASWSSTAS